VDTTVVSQQSRHPEEALRVAQLLGSLSVLARVLKASTSTPTYHIPPRKTLMTMCAINGDWKHRRLKDMMERVRGVPMQVQRFI